MLPSVQIVQGQGGTQNPSTNLDFYSGLMLYGTAPSVAGKWATQAGTPSIKFQEMFSAVDATSAGILPNTENTANTYTIEITTAGATSDTVTLIATVPGANGTTTSVNLGTYTVLSGSTTIAEQGAAWAVVINALTYITGFSATFATATLTITAPKSIGVSFNTGTPYATTFNAGTTFVMDSPAIGVSGTASQYAIWYYHISEYFRINPTGVLYVGIISASSSFNELTTLQLAAGGQLSQIGVYDKSTTTGLAANITGTLTEIQDVINVSEQLSPYVVIYSPNIAAVSDLSTYPDQNLNTAEAVLPVISQDGLAQGGLLFVQSGQTVGNVGARLGSVSSSRVSSSDAQPISQFNMSNGVENNTPAFGNGLLSSTVSSGLQTQLDNNRYSFFRQFASAIVGTYWTDNKTAISSTNSYCFLNDNRVYNKISRLSYAALLPLLSSEVYYTSAGTMQQYAVNIFKNAIISNVVASMISGQGSSPEISAAPVVTINPNQNVRANGITISETYTENGIARQIILNLQPA